MWDRRRTTCSPGSSPARPRPTCRTCVGTTPGSGPRPASWRTRPRSSWRRGRWAWRGPASASTWSGTSPEATSWRVLASGEVTAPRQAQTPEVENAVLQWEDGYRNLEAARSEPTLYRALGRAVVSVQEELRKRLGSRFSVRELAS